MDKSHESIDDENKQDIETNKHDDKIDCSVVKENRSNNEKTEPNDIHSNFGDDDVMKIEETANDLMTASTITGVYQKTKSIIESNNVDNDPNRDCDMDYSKISNESHNSKAIMPKTDENHGESTIYNLSQHKLNQNESKNDVVTKIETEEFSSNNVNANIPDNQQCDICGQFMYDSDIIYYQGHPQDAVEEFIALTNDKLVLSAGNYYFCLLSFLHKL